MFDQALHLIAFIQAKLISHLNLFFGILVSFISLRIMIVWDYLDFASIKQALAYVKSALKAKYILKKIY